MSDISKLLYVISRAVRRVKFVTILKYHEWYLCQISRTNHAIICFYYYLQRFCNFQIQLKYHCSKPIKLQKFLMQWYNGYYFLCFSQNSSSRQKHFNIFVRPLAGTLLTLTTFLKMWPFQKVRSDWQTENGKNCCLCSLKITFSLNILILGSLSHVSLCFQRAYHY